VVGMEHSSPEELEKAERELREEFPHVEISLSGNGVSVTVPSAVGTYSRLYSSVEAVRFLGRNTDGFKKVTLLNVEGVVGLGPQLYAFLTIPEWQQNATDADYILHYHECTLRVLVTREVPSYGDRLSVRNTDMREDYLARMKKGEMVGEIRIPDAAARRKWDGYFESLRHAPEAKVEAIWGALLAESLAYDAVDKSAGVIRFPFDAKTMFPHLLRLEPCRMVVIEPADGSTDCAKTVVLNWNSLLTNICFDYYYHCGALMVAPWMQPGRWDFQTAYLSSASSYGGKLTESIFRPIDPVLMEHFSVAVRSDIPTFSYLSYYHVLEHFFERATFRDLSEEIRKIVIKPDFLSKKELYTESIIRILGKRIPKTIPEQDKLFLVLKNLVPFTLVKTWPSEIISHLSVETRLDGGHVIPPVSLDDEKKFFSDLANRIYGLRCAIVHSNPDFEERQYQIPMTEKNMDVINEENRIMRILAAEVTGNASVFNL